MFEVVRQCNDKYGYVNKSKLIEDFSIPRKDFYRTGRINKYGGLQKICDELHLRYISDSELDIIEKTRHAMIECDRKYGYCNTILLNSEFGVTARCLHLVGGVKNACNDMGLTYHCALRYNAEDVLSDIKKFYDENGYIRLEDYISNGGYSKCAIRSAFGGFNNALEYLGIPISMHKNVGKEEVVSDITNIIEEYGTSSCTIYRRHGKYSQVVIDRIFGSWGNALKELGYASVRKRYGKERMIKDLQDTYDKFGILNKTIISQELEFTYEAASYVFNGRHGIEAAINRPGCFNGNKSAGHVMTRAALTELFGERGFSEEQTFDWLINPNTGKHLYMDFYIPSENVCIEYQGQQHYIWTKWFAETEDEFIAAQQRDADKKYLAENHGMRLIYIPYTQKVSSNYIANEIKKIKS